MSLADELLKLEQLRERGTLTAEEFDRAKARLLSPAPEPVVPSEFAQAINRLRRSDGCRLRRLNRYCNLHFNGFGRFRHGHFGRHCLIARIRFSRLNRPWRQIFVGGYRLGSLNRGRSCYRRLHGLRRGRCGFRHRRGLLLHGGCWFGHRLRF